MKRKIVKASEIQLAQSTKDLISKMIAPIEAWNEIEQPAAYLESRTGRYIQMLEAVANKFAEEGDLHGLKGCLNDLLRYTKLGLARAEITMTGAFNKLRNETDLSKVDIEALLKATGRSGEPN
jgi:hypothetical protein